MLTQRLPIPGLAAADINILLQQGSVNRLQGASYICMTTARPNYNTHALIHSCPNDKHASAMH